MWAPFINDSDDVLAQLAQLQIFLTILSSLALRAMPPSAFVGSLVTALLFVVPSIGIDIETPLMDVVKEWLQGLNSFCIAHIFPIISQNHHPVRPAPSQEAGEETEGSQTDERSFTVVEDIVDM